MKIAIIMDCVDDSTAGIATYAKNLVSNLLNVDKTNQYYRNHHSPNIWFKEINNKNVKVGILVRGSIV